MIGYEKEKAWAAKFDPEIKAILGTHLITTAPKSDDERRNTDLCSMRLKALRIDCRVRKFSFMASFGDEFTIRAERNYDYATELVKIAAGYGDYLFYGFANQEETALAAWFIGRLDVFRAWLFEQMGKHGKIPGALVQNNDDSGAFRAFSLNDMPEGFLVARLSPHAGE